MSDDASDAVAEAIALNKHLAATKVVRKDELAAELADLRKLRAQSPGDEAAIDARIEAAEFEMVGLDLQLKNVMREIDELRKLGRGLPAAVARAQVNAILHPDPVLQSPEQAVLERTRENIGNLDVQARLGDELAALDKPDRAPAPKPLSKADADAEARAKFEQLRAQRTGGGPGASAGDSSSDEPPPRPPSKKTL